MKISKENIIIICKLLILLSIPLLSFFFFITPFDKQVLISSHCDPIYEPNTTHMREIRCYYDYKKTDVVEQLNNRFRIKSDDLRSSDLLRSTFNNFFNVQLGLGWHYLCYHNEKSTFYLGGVPTNITTPIIFTLWDDVTDLKQSKDIRVNVGQTICEKVYINKDFIVTMNNKWEIPSYAELEKYAYDNKIDYPRHLKNPGFSQMKSDIYVKPIWYLVIIKNLLLFIVWSGVVLFFVQIKKFILNK